MDAARQLHELHVALGTGTEPTCLSEGENRAVVNISMVFAVKFLMARLAVILAEGPAARPFCVLSEVNGWMFHSGGDFAAMGG